jgi:hypothetical protein
MSVPNIIRAIFCIKKIAPGIVRRRNNAYNESEAMLIFIKEGAKDDLLRQPGLRQGRQRQRGDSLQAHQ